MVCKEIVSENYRDKFSDTISYISEGMVNRSKMKRKRMFREDYPEETTEEDDGRTIADMSQVSRGRLLGTWHQKQTDTSHKSSYESVTEQRPWEDSSFSRREQRMYALGALKAALLIGLVYLGGLGGLIALMLFLW